MALYVGIDVSKEKFDVSGRWIVIHTEHSLADVPHRNRLSPKSTS